MAELGVLGDPMELEATLQQSGMTVSGLEAATANIPSIQGYSVRVNDSQNRIPQAPGRGGAELSTSAHIAHGNPLVVPLLVTDKQHTSNESRLTESLHDNVDLNCATPETLRFDFPTEEELHQTVKGKQSIKRVPPAVYRDQDRFVPINNIGRTMRNCIPKTGKVSKDAKECMQECVSEFISFLTSEASDRCLDEKRKTITGDDILFALSNLGFDCYVEPLQLYLKKYREHTRSDKTDKDGAQDSPLES